MMTCHTQDDSYLCLSPSMPKLRVPKSAYTLVIPKVLPLPDVKEKYVDTILLKHRQLVFALSKIGGIAKLGAVHDLSKYGEDELVPYYNHWVLKKTDPFNDNQFKQAFHLHAHRNAHHLEYWHDTYPEAMFDYPHFVEIICDWISASKIHTEQDGNIWSPKCNYDYWMAFDSKKPMSPKNFKLLDTWIKDFYKVGILAFSKEYLKMSYLRVAR